MQGKAKPAAADDRRDFIVIPSDQVRVAPSDAEITDLLRAAARQHSEAEVRAALETQATAPVPALDTTFRATAVNDDVPARGPTLGRRLMRTFAALLVAAGIGGAALTWQTFGYAAKKAVVSWAPKWAITASLPLEQLGLGRDAKPSDEPADATAAAPAAATPAQAAADPAASDNTAANAAAPSSDTTQQLQSMARDLASANQQIETLKASIAELKAGQQQMTRDLAKASDKVVEQNAKAKIAAAPAHPTTAAHKPASTYSPSAAYSPSPTPAPPPGYRPAPAPYSAQASAAAAPPPVAAQPYVPPPPIPLQSADPGIVGAAPRPPMPVQ